MGASGESASRKSTPEPTVPPPSPSPASREFTPEPPSPPPAALYSSEREQRGNASPETVVLSDDSNGGDNLPLDFGLNFVPPNSAAHDVSEVYEWNDGWDDAYNDADEEEEEEEEEEEDDDDDDDADDDKEDDTGNDDDDVGDESYPEDVQWEASSSENDEEGGEGGVIFVEPPVQDEPPGLRSSILHALGRSAAAAISQADSQDV